MKKIIETLITKFLTVCSAIINHIMDIFSPGMSLTNMKLVPMRVSNQISNHDLLLSNQIFNRDFPSVKMGTVPQVVISFRSGLSPFSLFSKSNLVAFLSRVRAGVQQVLPRLRNGLAMNVMSGISIVPQIALAGPMRCIRIDG